ncbi:uncharacterized protein LOC6735210 [Drosophila simulans]|uniref:Uncharacterized protein n=1 Tax=Drosophila simulans TaxID=7240 RepID=A0A0J9RGC8_DROSI|nr:uncharacterized protein LOC6735210 [Drosophila simulans]KMY94976.1 uncharacterized protein Dsimw501_GD25341 [Drosophila simulans]
MDAAYVKFMMCRCLMNRADWGLAIGCMNIVYSFFLFQFWAVELVRSLNNYTIKWVLLYGFNMMFNVIAMMRIVKRESISVFYWMCETGALLIFRVHHIYYNVDEFWLAESKLYHVCNIIIDAYIGLSLLAMIYVMCGLELESQYPEDEMENDCKFDPESAKRAAQKDEAELLARNQEEQAHLEQRKLESDREMEELNRKATLKLAQLEEEGSLSSQEIAPTAPEEENLDSSIFLMQDFPGPSAPPESVLSIEPDFYYEINDIVDSGDQQNY